MSYLGVLVRQFHLQILVTLLVASFGCPAFSQTSSATLSATVSDPSGAVIQKADVALDETETNQQQHLLTDAAGNVTFNFLRPGHYNVLVSKADFADITVNEIVLNVGDERHLRLVLRVGSNNETVKVDGSGQTINTTDGSVSTVIDRQFVENMPLNGRSFQDLILLSPGVVTNSPQSPSTAGNTGEFSVNGQRTESNYYTVDGVSANGGAPTSIGGAGTAGALPASTTLGTTQALVSVDALQEFRVQGSTYSAEFGRSPGGQFSMVTRSGTNDTHGTLFDYFRNDALDANNWFNDNTTPVTAKTAERQNDFGGTLAGPVFVPHLYDGENKTFFFFSYEGMRLVQPQPVSVNYVPTAAFRQSAPQAVRQILNAFPLPSTNAPDLGDGLTEFISGWSTPNNIDSSSIRLDQVIGPKVRVFFRFSYVPSDSESRGTSAVTATATNFSSPSVLTTSSARSITYTGGATTTISNTSNDEFRINFSKARLKSMATLDSFGGATPFDFLTVQGMTSSSETYDLGANLYFDAYDPGIDVANGYTTQSQWNFVDTFGISLRHHQLKFGVDYRRLSPVANSGGVVSYYEFDSEVSALANTLDYGYGESYSPNYPVYSNLSLFAQDQWQVASRFNLDLGLRWDVNPAPGVAKGLMPYTVIGLNDLSTLALAAQGTKLWDTSWFNLAPRLGFAYWSARCFVPVRLLV